MRLRLRALYLRYAAAHVDRARGFALPRHRLRRTGRLEKISRRNGRIALTGWTSAPKIHLTWPKGEICVTPDINRLGVAQRLGVHLKSGFSVDLPDGAFPLRLRIEPAPGRGRSVDIPDPARPPHGVIRLRLMLGLLRDLCRAFAPGVRWLLFRSEVDRNRIKRRLGLGNEAAELQIDPRYLGQPSTARARRPITIILPVHDAFDPLRECLRRIALHTDLPWHLILVEDASRDVRIRPFLRSWTKGFSDQVTLLENKVNQGFVGAVNQAFPLALTRAEHLVLLNSDAFVPAGWASRLLAPIEADASVASVTPLSNDAEIFSVPMICQPNRLGAGMADALDRLAQRLSHPPTLASAPTGVGFCMAMSLDWVRRLPQFDPIFGPGYGEEVDWCQQIRALGGRHVGLPTLFVEHQGGQSFGKKGKNSGIARANGILARRYPRYDLEVQSYIAQDPLRTARLALSIGQAGLQSEKPIPLFVAHSLGGGAELALRREIDGYTRHGKMALVLRVGGKARWRLEVHESAGSVAASTADMLMIRKMLRPISRLKIIYSCGVGDPDPVALPDAILSLRRPDRADLIEARLHDYFMISPSYCLLQSDGRFHGVSRRDLANSIQGFSRSDGSPLALRDWHLAWHRLLMEAQEITAFSHASKRIFETVYPTVAGRIRLCPHRPTTSVAPIRPDRDAPPVLGVLGNINRQKGAEILCGLARHSAQQNGP